MRTFFAIDFAVANNKGIVELIQQLKTSENYPQVIWTKPENLHLTLRFLGTITTDQCVQLITKVDTALKNFAPFKISLAELMLFPNEKQQIALALKPETNASLMKLNQILEQAVAAGKLVSDPRPFMPHLTLGKIKGKPVKKLIPVKLPKLACTINNLKLYRSENSPNGPIYKPLACFKFS
jgi:2'-5' RNA ligase